MEIFNDRRRWARIGVVLSLAYCGGLIVVLSSSSRYFRGDDIIGFIAGGLGTIWSLALGLPWAFGDRGRSHD